MRVFVTYVVLLTGILLAWVAWGPLPQGRMGDRMLHFRQALGLESADSCYRVAELLYEAGDFEKALVKCEKALAHNPRHVPARALLTEVSFILGVGKATPSSGEYDQYMHRSNLSQLLPVEVDNALARAERYREAGDSDAGMIEVRKVLEYLKWMPDGPELDERKRRALDLKDLFAMCGSASPQ